MIRSATELQQEAKKFLDTEELATELETIASEEFHHSLGHAYYLKESAVHMLGMYSLLLEATRALKALERT